MTLPRAVAGTYAALVLAAVVAPALVLGHAGGRGGLDASDGADLIGVSVAVGVPAALLAWRRVRPPASGRGSRTDIGIAGLISFGVLAAAASALPTLVLHATTGSAALDADSGWPVLVVWAAAQAAAVAAGEATHRGVLRWLGG